MRTTFLTFVTVICVLVTGSVALSDDVIKPPWRDGDRTVTAVWDIWPDGDPDWWLEIPPDPGSWSSNPPLPDPPSADLLGDSWYYGSIMGRDDVIETVADWEVQFNVPNFSKNLYKDVWVQITFFLDTDTMMAGIDVWSEGIMDQSAEEFEGSVDHGDGWVTEAWSQRIWPNPSEENIALYFLDPEGPSPYELGVLIDQVVIDTRCIPEPATLSLLAIGGLTLMRRRRK